ncbi:MAG: diaminopimelate decarboxylase [Candidatus Aenigmarchaeota archaeon]|nr:diaminopimelate decarboxylase [Candidatus Aenigmarchaeota archaeon]
MWWEIPGHLESRDGNLYIGGQRAEAFAHVYGTPLHVYNGDRAVQNYRRFHDALASRTEIPVRVHYAMKTNSHRGILELLCREGAWIDAVSPGEAMLAVDAGYAPEKILYTGSSVSVGDMRMALNLGVRINIDSAGQVGRMLEANCRRSGSRRVLPVSIRVDPGVTGAGHVPENITTGRVTIHGEEVPTKFGVDMSDIHDVVREADRIFGVAGLHFHIGSNWRTEEEIVAFLGNLDAALGVAKDAHGYMGRNLGYVDFGGGPGVRYRKEHREFPVERYADETVTRVDESGLVPDALAFEPGRYISGDSGILLATVTDVKRKSGETVVGLDTGFNHLPRPEVYNSHHHIVLCGRADSELEGKFMFAGNVCETGDFLSRDPIRRETTRPREGDVVAFLTTGAYVKAMEMTNYNTRPPVPELLLAGGKSYSLTTEKVVSETTML